MKNSVGIMPSSLSHCQPLIGLVCMKTFGLVLLVGVVFGGSAIGQTVNASLGGYVTDATGAALPGATVTVTGINTGVVTKTLSNEAGVYQFPSLQAGDYKITAELSGFDVFIYDKFTFDVGAQVRL